jgi:hypothetical protein
MGSRAAYESHRGRWSSGVEKPPAAFDARRGQEVEGIVDGGSRQFAHLGGTGYGLDMVAAEAGEVRRHPRRSKPMAAAIQPPFGVAGSEIRPSMDMTAVPPTFISWTSPPIIDASHWICEGRFIS